MHKNVINYIPERYIDGHPQSISIDALKKILFLLEKCICKVKHQTGTATGFFSNIYLDEWEPIRVFITNNHVLDEDNIKPGKAIFFSLNNEKEKFEIEIDESRKTYTNEEYDVTIIEIKKKDNLPKDSFLDIDNNICEQKNSFLNQAIYLLHYPEGKTMYYSQGIIKTIFPDKYNIEHTCASNFGSSGGPLINTTDYKIIGIHKGGSKQEKYYNIGTFLKEPIEEFKTKYRVMSGNKNKNQNNIQENDINNNENEDYKINRINTIPIPKNNYKKENKSDKTKNNIISERIEIVKYKNEINLIYKANQGKHKIFGKRFVENNKYNIKLDINGIESQLIDEFDLKEGDNIIKLIIKNNLTNLESMFNDCQELSNIEELKYLNTNHCTNFSYIFASCWRLSDIKSIVNWNVSNGTNFSHMFYECSSLSDIKALEKWNVSKGIDFSYMFYNCSSLINIKPLEKWNLSKCTNFSNMFFNCSSLLDIKPLEKWNVSNGVDFSSMFSWCKKISDIKPLEKWNVINGTNFNNLFSWCQSLSDIEGLENWNVSNGKYFNDIFYECSVSLDIKPLKKWKELNENIPYDFDDSCNIY